ncbi:MAG: 4-hydroxy-tetrahydrodipicolinate reductase [Planctomycetes bacterium]|nr:4-hydroxy-tetrahydrodipicolinate reductase [Planctomycetota bacterium]MBL7146116.1 4-hydroxy-tetrahydrodipicolinate reductase [Phycisphaerae bacterium]
MNTKLVVVGAAGRMGKRIIALAVEAGQFDIVGAVEIKGHQDIGKDIGLLAGTGAIDIKLADTFPKGGEVAIDFSLAEAADKTLDYCLENKLALVSGTTGLSSAQREKFKAASEEIPIIYGTNMSVGMNVLFNLVGKVATMLGDEYDIEITEQHHRFKKDAPSGSALTLAENICKATGRDIDTTLTHGRSGESLRKKGTIGMHAVRAGDIVGDHSVIFGTLGETVSVNHTANSRDTFVRGALRAAKWLVGKGPGLYSMADVLGIKF